MNQTISLRSRYIQLFSSINSQTNAAYRGPSAIPLLALHVINFMYLFILHKNIQLWLLDSYPLHINYCYNIILHSLSSFNKLEWIKQMKNKSFLLFELVDEWKWSWMVDCRLHWIAFTNSKAGVNGYMFSCSFNSIFISPSSTNFNFL